MTKTVQEAHKARTSRDWSWWSSIGTSSKTKPPASNREAGCRCSGTHFRVTHQRC